MPSMACLLCSARSEKVLLMNTWYFLFIVEYAVHLFRSCSLSGQHCPVSSVASQTSSCLPLMNSAEEEQNVSIFSHKHLPCTQVRPVERTGGANSWYVF